MEDDMADDDHPRSAPGDDPLEPGRPRVLSTLLPPNDRWWVRLGPDERRWLTIAFVWCLVLFSGMYIWLAIGNQQTPIESYRIDPFVFQQEVEAFVEEYQVDEIEGAAIVEPPPGSDVYLQANMFAFRPVLKLQKDQEYRLLVSSTDVQHGLSLQPTNLNFQVLPGYLYVIRITPDEVGEFPIVCNEYCGLGHHVMTGLIVVD
jgi:cytochrome c oxidase subunit II